MTKKLTKAILLLSVICGVIISTSNKASAQVDPWPFGKPMPFPWTSIEGLWEGTSTNSKVLFSFKVVGDRTSSRQLRVLQLEPETLEILAQGVGFEDQKVVKAYMVAHNGAQYVLTVRKVREKKKKTVGYDVVLTISENDLGADTQSFNYVLEKISDFPLETKEKNKCPLNNLSTNEEKFD